MPFICLISPFYRVYCHTVRLIIGVGFFLGICYTTGYAQNTVYAKSVQPDSHVIMTDSLPCIELRKNTVLKQRMVFDVWIDSTQSYTIDSVLRHDNLPFKRTQSDILSLEYKKATIWCRFVVRYYESAEDSLLHSTSQKFGTNAPPKPHSEPFILYTMNRQADTAIFICVNPATGSISFSDTNGYSIPYNQWSVKTSALAFMIPDDEHPAFFRVPQANTHTNHIDAYKEMVCYVQFRTHSFSIISLRAIEYHTFFSNSENIRARFGIWFGFSVFAACYNLILFIVTRSRFYIFYVGSVVCFALYYAIDSGQAYSVLQTDPDINTHLLYASGLLYNVLSALFVRAFWMECREYVPRALNYALLVYVSLNIMAIAVELYGAGYIAYFLLNYSFMFMGAPLMLAGTFLIWRKGYTPARYLFIARCFSEIGIMLNIVLLGNIIQTHIPLWAGRLAGYMQEIAPMLELLLFSFALAARFTVLQQEKQAAEREALQGEAYRRENELLHNANLEITRQQNEIVHLNHALQEQNTELAKANQEKDDIMGMVVHDLKNPIGTVRGFAELISQGMLEDQQVEDALLHILSTSDRMLGMVKNLLTINHLESGAFVISSTHLNLSTVIEGYIEEFQMIAEKKNITIHFVSDGNTSDICAEESIVLQVFDNLISNAIKYSPTGCNVYVRIFLNQETNNVRLEVQDEGAGISEEDMKKLFGKFMKLSAQPTGGEHSTGLGLSIVKKMVETMNGKVWCESETGKGATFIVELPSQPQPS